MTAEVLVVGGGPAGAAAAARLAAAGRDVLLAEREAGPVHKVCGEFLSGPTLAGLEELGVDAAALGAAPIWRSVLARGGRRAARALPFPAMSLSRRALDEALLQRAAALGARMRRGARVVRLEREGGEWRADFAGGGCIRSARVVLAAGKHDLRGWRRPPGGQDDLVGFKMHWRPAAPPGDAVELHLFPGGYAGLEPVEDGCANLCLLVRKSALARLAGWDGLLDAMCAASPLLARRLAGAVPQWSRPLAAAGLPYGFVARQSGGLWRVGDQAAVIPSFAGEGLAIALRSGRRAADSILAGEDAQAFQTRLHAELAAPVARAALLSRLLVRPGAQRVLAAAAERLPGLIGLTASATRIAPLERAAAE